MNNDKLIDLETKIAYQEQSIDQLSEVVFEQSKRIDELHRELIKLGSKIASASMQEPLPDPLDEKPPHY